MAPRVGHGAWGCLGNSFELLLPVARLLSGAAADRPEGPVAMDRKTVPIPVAPPGSPPPPGPGRPGVAVPRWPGRLCAQPAASERLRGTVPHFASRRRGVRPRGAGGRAPRPAHVDTALPLLLDGPVDQKKLLLRGGAQGRGRHTRGAAPATMRRPGGAPGRLPLLLLLALVLRAGGARGGWVTDLLGGGKSGEVRPAPGGPGAPAGTPPTFVARARRSGGIRGRAGVAGDPIPRSPVPPTPGPFPRAPGAALPPVLHLSPSLSLPPQLLPPRFPPRMLAPPGAPRPRPRSRAPD